MCMCMMDMLTPSSTYDSQLQQNVTLVLCQVILILSLTLMIIADCISEEIGHMLKLDVKQMQAEHNSLESFRASLSFVLNGWLSGE